MTERVTTENSTDEIAIEIPPLDRNLRDSSNSFVSLGDDNSDDNSDDTNDSNADRYNNYDSTSINGPDVESLSETDHDTQQPTQINQLPPLAGPPVPIALNPIRNQERFGTLTGIMQNTGPSSLEEIGLGPRNVLYITNHDPGDVKPLPAQSKTIQLCYDIQLCSMPFKYGIFLIIAIVIIDLISIVIAAFNYGECSDSIISLPFYLICRSALSILSRIHDVIIYYSDCCWTDIKICGVKLTFEGIKGLSKNYKYYEIYGLILAWFFPVIDTLVGVIFLITFFGVCSPLIWGYSLGFIIVCCPVRSIIMR